MPSRDGEGENAPPKRFQSTTSKALSTQGFGHQCLARSKFFGDRDQTFLMTISREFSIEVFAPGANIMLEGDHGDKMYFLHRGEVEILIGPQETRVATLSDGNVFGEMALFGHSRRSATVRARESCDCRVISHKVFGQILKSFPTELKFFRAVAAERLGQVKQAQKDTAGDIFRRGTSTGSEDLFAQHTPQHRPTVSRRRGLAQRSWAERAKYEEQLRASPGSTRCARGGSMSSRSTMRRACAAGAGAAESVGQLLPAVSPQSSRGLESSGDKAMSEAMRSTQGRADTSTWLLPLGDSSGSSSQWSWQEQLCGLLCEPAPHALWAPAAGAASASSQRGASPAPESPCRASGGGLSRDVASRWLGRGQAAGFAAPPSIGLLELAVHQSAQH
eukprot:CAMPEP_0176117410 /NCGR_PEP_ID=MMETSP0120_2-20121206/58985_1 /TAXON_ID=160619 /ORGANISM="Kryptoperidinium foliaceum, Strain CCMP 1326" /LENGTH=389 /DNA_ID=CAMNT_0017451703 /DNA_START=63 /DNA_END=1232 /DNA_ORIENTATION=+